MKTYMAKPGELKPQWWIVDGKDKVVGRLASEIAMILMGKHRPTYTPHVVSGDCVVVVNCEQVKFTGTKWDKKRYTWYTGYPGLHVQAAKDRLASNPKDILRLAVRRMLPKNKLAYKLLSNMKLYVGPNHEQQAQQPQPLTKPVRN